MAEPEKPFPDEEVHILDYCILLAKYSRSILGVSVAAAVLTYLIVFILPKKYTASACIMPPQQNVSLAANVFDSLGIANSPAAAGSALMGGMSKILGKSPGDIYVGMMESNSVYDRIIQRFNLREVYEEDHIEDVRKRLSKRADIKSGKDNLISIEVTDEDPKRAADMANAFVEELDKLMLGMTQTDAKNYVVFLEQERDKASKTLTKAENALRGFSEKTSVVQIDAQAKGMIEYIANLRASIDAKEVQMQILQKQAANRNYDLVRLDTEIQGLKEKLRAAETQADCIGDVCIATSKFPTLGLEYLRLYREAKYREAIYYLYGKLLELAYLDASRNVSNVQFVTRATVPEKRSNTRLAPTLIVGLVFFFLMVGIAIFRENWEHIKTSENHAHRLAILQFYLQPYMEKIARIKSLLIRKKYLGKKY